MNDKDKHFIEKYEELLNKGYCNCNEMNCIDNNSPRRILDIVKQLQSNWNSLRECIDYQLKHNVGSSVESSIRNHVYQEIKDKMNELEGNDK